MLYLQPLQPKPSRIATKQQFMGNSLEALEGQKNAEAWRKTLACPAPGKILERSAIAEDQIAGLNREVLRRQNKMLQDQRAIDHVQAGAGASCRKLSSLLVANRNNAAQLARHVKELNVGRTRHLVTRIVRSVHERLRLYSQPRTGTTRNLPKCRTLLIDERKGPEKSTGLSSSLFDYSSNLQSLPAQCHPPKPASQYRACQVQPFEVTPQFKCHPKT